MIETLRDDTSLRGRLPVLATAAYMGVLHADFGWFRSDDFAIPFVMERKLIFRRLFFHNQSIALRENADEEAERRFLNQTVAAARALGADCIVQPPMHVVFRTTPDGAVRAPCLTYRMDLRRGEEDMQSGLHHNHRKAINKAIKDGVEVRSDEKALEDCFRLHVETQARNGVVPEFRFETLLALRDRLGDGLMAHAAYLDGEPQGGVISAWNPLGGYALTAGSAESRYRGAINLIYWRAMLDIRERDVPFYDFSGGVVDPPADSKHAGIQLFKARFGAEPLQGWLWKQSLRPLRHAAMRAAIAAREIILHRRRPSPDVIDRERERHGT